jgi:hypothetical protein
VVASGSWHFRVPIKWMFRQRQLGLWPPPSLPIKTLRSTRLATSQKIRSCMQVRDVLCSFTIDSHNKHLV